MFMLSNGKRMFPTPQIPERRDETGIYASFSTFLLTAEKEHYGQVYKSHLGATSF